MIIGWAKAHKRVAVLVILVLIVLGVGVTLTISHIMTTNDAKKKNANIANMNNLIKQASPLLDSNKHDELGKIVEQLKQINVCNTSVDCLYVITKYYIGISDSKNTRTYYDKLASVFHNSNTKMSSFFKVNATKLTELEGIVKFLEKQAEFYKSNVIFIGEASK